MQLTYRGSFYHTAPSVETTESATTLKYRGVTMRQGIPSEMPATESALTLTYRGNRYITLR